MNKIVHIGMDVGSTTVKIVVMDEDLKEIYTSYERHYSDTKNTVCKVLEELVEKYKDKEFTIALTGSGAMSTAKFLDVPFIQEVVACKRSVERYIPQTNVVIELGGEDAKIIYFGRSVEQRMNGTCAGGTGAFLDQMASLLNTDTAGLNELAKGYQTIYPIASRCGVFAKTDVQPLLNEGAEKVYAELSKYYNCEFDDRGNIGKRYRRQDEIGTPFCITYDFDSEEDGAVTVRDRDTMQQERIKIADLKAYFEDKFRF